MKILLIYPYCQEERVHTEDSAAAPIGIYYVGAMLKARGYDADVLNLHHLKGRPAEIEALLRQKQPDVIGFSVLQANRWGAVDIARQAKQLDPGVSVVFGGVAPTLLWRHFLTHFPEVDYVVTGEGEAPFLGLVKCLESGRQDRVADIGGIALRQNGEIVITPPPAPLKNLDDLPDPARYFSFNHVALTRGCASDCTFCGSPRLWGRRVRFHSADYFVGQLERLHRRGVGLFYVSDDTFTVNPSRVIEICWRIIEKRLNITWAAISRVDLVHEEALMWMRRAGCIQISYGVESGSDKIRTAALGKIISKSQIRAAFDLTVKYGIMARAYFIYGCPGETRDTIQETLDLMREIKPLSAVFYILDLFPGTALYEDYARRTGITDDVWLNRIEDILYFETDPGLSQEMIFEFGKTLRETFYGSLPGFVEAVRLVDDEALRPFNADFYSRLGMTFDRGEYANNENIPHGEETARFCYHKALAYHPDPRAYLGLGLIEQKYRRYPDSIRILEQGIDLFPEHPQLNICIGLSHLNLGDPKRALTHFAKFPDVPEAVHFAKICQEAIGNGSA